MQSNFLRPEKSVEIVREVLLYYDPEKIASEATSDQYDVEAAVISGFVFAFRTDIENQIGPLLKYINRVWNLYFQHDCADVENVAIEIAARIAREVGELPDGSLDPNLAINSGKFSFFEVE